MNKFLCLSGATALGLVLASVAGAQTTVTGTEALDDRLDDITEAAQDDIDRADDNRRFGNPDFRPGLSGSASLSYSGISGENDSQELTAGARLRYAQGQWVQSIGFAVDFAEFENSSTSEEVFAVYDANYYFDDSFYAFALGRISTDGLADRADETATDAFIGFGPGYRIVNREDLTWRVQAGIGVSYLENGDGDDETETGYIASSRLYWKLTDTVFATNDTDILKSDSALRVNNDLGVNFKISDSFATRASYLTEYNDSRDVETDNKLGLSLVYGF